MLKLTCLSDGYDPSDPDWNRRVERAAYVNPAQVASVLVAETGMGCLLVSAEGCAIAHVKESAEYVKQLVTAATNIDRFCHMIAPKTLSDMVDDPECPEALKQEIAGGLRRIRFR